MLLLLPSLLLFLTNKQVAAATDVAACLCSCFWLGCCCGYMRSLSLPVFLMLLVVLVLVPLLLHLNMLATYSCCLLCHYRCFFFCICWLLNAQAS